MAKTYINAVKYEITATFKIDGIVDKHDIIGAIFGQSEGLLGEELDLRELQKNGKIGRILISHTAINGTTTGKIVVPSSMDMVETSILAAAIETVDKVGPCKASLVIKEITDTRTQKREEIVNRAQSLLERLMREQLPESEEIAQMVRERVRVSEICPYGPDKLPAGPAIEGSDSIIVVEGRADVLNLLKNSIKNVIGMDGSKISPTIVELGKKKSLTMFIDGDRGGELNLRKLASLTDVDFVAKAPDGKEVEELARKEIIMALRHKVPLSEEMERREGSFDRSPHFPRPFTPQPVQAIQPAEEGQARPFAPQPFGERRAEPLQREQRFGARPFQHAPRFAPRPFAVQPKLAEAPLEAVEPFAEVQPKFVAKPVKLGPSAQEIEQFKPAMDSLKGTLKAKIFDDQMKELEEVSVRDLLKTMKKHKEAKTVVLDGIITKRLLDAAEENNISTLVAAKEGKIEGSAKTKTIIIQ
ncbi:MAG: DNA primase DnaG [Candidatus Diapherotrites archaeon]|nr:DNA primase DnaG [Candidatus Diapherotrites archaeon]